LRALDPRTVTRFRRDLLRWFRRHGRDLPWRRTRDPYHVLVSEVMLQQTQVSRVQLFYTRFLDRWPTLQHLAAARSPQVRKQWEGLGYYRRAANLHALAKVVVAEHGGAMPRGTEALRKLPGVGPYTAGAVSCFAYEERTPAVDTNVARVIRRAFHPRRPKDPNDKVIWATAEKLVPLGGKNAWAFNQGIMELGALVCTARVAKCGECPVRGACKTGSLTPRPPLRKAERGSTRK
jgi:A/G-specific adenine glycosylase